MPDATRPDGSPDPAYLRISGIDIVDSFGRTRIVLGPIGITEAPGIAIFDETGSERVSLALHNTGPQLSFALDGTGVLDLGVTDAPLSPAPYVHFTEPDDFAP